MLLLSKVPLLLAAPSWPSSVASYMATVASVERLIGALRTRATWCAAAIIHVIGKLLAYHQF